MAQVATVYSVAPYERTITDVLHGLVRRDPAARPRLAIVTEHHPR
jgi:hypothetical protein